MDIALIESYILLFFTASFMGWCMEVLCKLIQFKSSKRKSHKVLSSWLRCVCVIVDDGYGTINQNLAIRSS